MYRLLVIITTLLFFQPAFAEDPGNYSFDKTEFEEEMIGSEITDDYVYPSLPVLSRMYWLLGELDYSNDNHIDGYLKINECKIYEKYRRDEFEWAKIQEITKKNIKDNLHTFDTKIDIVRPLLLDEYNMKEEYFELAQKESLRRTRIIDVAESDGREVCGSTFPVDGYPKILRVRLTRPLEIERIDVKKQLARYFLDDVQARYEGYDEKYLNWHYEREAYARLKVRVFQSFGVVYDMNDIQPRMYVMGELDGIEVYADKELTKPIYIENFKGKRKISKRRRRSVEDTAQPEKEERVYYGRDNLESVN